MRGFRIGVIVLGVLSLPLILGAVLASARTDRTATATACLPRSCRAEDSAGSIWTSTDPEKGDLLIGG
jgi:hypothetical protein